MSVYAADCVITGKARSSSEWPLFLELQILFVYLVVLSPCPCFQKGLGFCPVISEVAPAEIVLVHVPIQTRMEIYCSFAWSDKSPSNL